MPCRDAASNPVNTVGVIDALRGYMVVKMSDAYQGAGVGLLSFVPGWVSVPTLALWNAKSATQLAVEDQLYDAQLQGEPGLYTIYRVTDLGVFATGGGQVAVPPPLNLPVCGTMQDGAVTEQPYGTLVTATTCLQPPTMFIHPPTQLDFSASPTDLCGCVPDGAFGIDVPGLYVATVHLPYLPGFTADACPEYCIGVSEWYPVIADVPEAEALDNGQFQSWATWGTPVVSTGSPYGITYRKRTRGGF